MDLVGIQGRAHWAKVRADAVGQMPLSELDWHRILDTAVLIARD